MENIGKILKEYLRKPPYVSGISTHLSLHEGLKSQLYVFGFKYGYKPILESRPIAFFDKKYRFDCIFCDKENNIKVVIELDRYIKNHSLKKMNLLPPGIEKILISYGNKENSYVKSKTRMSQSTDNIQIIRIFESQNIEC